MANRYSTQRHVGRAPSCACRAPTPPTICSGWCRTTCSPASSCQALLLTAKARVIAPLVVWRRGRRRLPAPHRARARRGRARAPDAHALRGEVRDRRPRSTRRRSSSAALPVGTGGSRTPTTAGRRSRCSTQEIEPTLDDAELERLRIEAGTPRFGRELDDRVLPAETGLVERAVSFTKGCYPGQEPIARQHHRGKVNRRAARARSRRRARATPETPVSYAGKEVGRITSSVPGLALAYVRVEVPDDAELAVAGISARLH